MLDDINIYISALLSPNDQIKSNNLLQWNPQILKRGANINDRDGLTDMTLLHYASKSGAAGIGDAEAARRIVSMLIDAGADVNIRCRWTNMAALHYASYFDVVPVLKILLKASKALGKCQVFNDCQACKVRQELDRISCAVSWCLTGNRLTKYITTGHKMTESKLMDFLKGVSSFTYIWFWT